MNIPYITNIPGIEAPEGYDMNFYSPEAMDALARQQEEESKRIMGDAYYSDGPPAVMNEIPPGPPPPLDVTASRSGAPSLADESGMPKIWKAPSKDQNIPPGPPPPGMGGAQDESGFQETKRAKFLDVFKQNLGFDPTTFDPVGQAFKETKKEFLERYGPDYILSSGTEEEFEKAVNRKLMEYGPKKAMGDAALKFAISQFDEAMGFTKVPKGGVAVNEMGERIEAPDTPNEMELRIRADKGDPQAQRILAAKQEEDLKQVREGVKARNEVTEKDIVKPLLNKLPKMQENAQASQKRVLMYQNLSEMAEKGAGGLVPGLRGIMSPVLEALGMDTKIESEAQAYQLMARAGVGKMRLELVGSGQVSNYEQDLMQRISGASIKTSREAAKQLFKYYAKEAQQTIDDYNRTIDDLKDYPEVKVYRKVGKTASNGIPDRPKFTVLKVK